MRLPNAWNQWLRELQTRLADNMDKTHNTGCCHGQLPCLLESGSEPMRGPWHQQPAKLLNSGGGWPSPRVSWRRSTTTEVRNFAARKQWGAKTLHSEPRHSTNLIPASVGTGRWARTRLPKQPLARPGQRPCNGNWHRHRSQRLTHRGKHHLVELPHPARCPRGTEVYRYACAHIHHN